MRDRLIELIRKADKKGLIFYRDNAAELSFANLILDDGWIRPPCKIGATIYMIVEKRAKVTREYFRFIKKTKLTFLNLERVLETWGKTVFLTKEEAEQALKGGVQND